MEIKRINAVILFMVLALVGIVWVQLTWFQNAVELKRTQFEQTVNDALYQVVHKVDRREAMEGMISSGNDGLLYSNYNNGINTISIKDEPSASDSSRNYTMRITQKDAYDTIADYVKKTITTTQKLENVNFPAFNLSQEFIDSITGNVKFSADNSIDYQTAVIEEALSQYILKNLKSDINERISGLELDSIVFEELDARGMHVRYEFGVFDAKGKPLLTNVCNEHNLDSITENSYQAKLFPNDWMKKGGYFLYVNFPNEKSYLLKRLGLPVIFSLLFTIIIAGVFFFTIRGVFHQRQLAVIKNDFINNMTHELKTPIATISLACEALGDANFSKSEELRNSFITTINEENNRLGVLVENALTTSVIDKGMLSLKPVELNVKDVLATAIKNSQLTANKKGGNIELVLPDKDVTFVADKLHFTNVIYNLIDNAVKYSGKKPEVTVTLESNNKSLKLHIKDNGIGISKENQKKIFDKLYRVPTGNVHNVRGYGLGLSYVKAIVSKHGGKILLNSTPGKGSTFTLIFNKTKNEQ